MNKIAKRIHEIKDYRKTRNPENDNDFMITILMNLLNNLNDRNNFIHKELQDYKHNKKKIDKRLKIIIGLYICSLVTCWETFFRDIFIYLCDVDPKNNSNVIRSLINEKPHDLTLGEYMATKYNFQNLNQTKMAFDDLLQKKTETISDYFSSEMFDGVFHKDYSLILKWIRDGSLKSNIDFVLKTGFEIRHKVTHDANYLINCNGKLLSKIECVFQVVPQLFIAYFAGIYSQKRMVFNLTEGYVRITDNPTKDEKNYAFTANDFMADDYILVK